MVLHKKYFPLILVMRFADDSEWDSTNRFPVCESENGVLIWCWENVCYWYVWRLQNSILGLLMKINLWSSWGVKLWSAKRKNHWGPSLAIMVDGSVIRSPTHSLSLFLWTCVRMLCSCYVALFSSSNGALIFVISSSKDLIRLYNDCYWLSGSFGGNQWIWYPAYPWKLMP